MRPDGSEGNYEAQKFKFDEECTLLCISAM